MVNKLYLVTHTIKFRAYVKNIFPEWWNNFWNGKPEEGIVSCHIYAWDCYNGNFEGTKERLKTITDHDFRLCKSFEYGWANRFDVLSEEFTINSVGINEYPKMKTLKEDLTSYEYLSMIREFLNEKKS